jgi:hypothetical protein
MIEREFGPPSSGWCWALFCLDGGSSFLKKYDYLFYQTTPYHHIPENSDLHMITTNLTKNMLGTILFVHWKHTQMKHETNFSDMSIWCVLIVCINTTENSFSNWNFINIYINNFQYKSLRVIWWRGSHEQTWSAYHYLVTLSVSMFL